MRVCWLYYEICLFIAHLEASAKATAVGWSALGSLSPRHLDPPFTGKDAVLDHLSGWGWQISPACDY
jgi:hypothetical protein